MRASSPPIATYKTPLKGMDAREVKPQDSPNLLFNIDLSNRGFWKERPGLRLFGSLAGSRHRVMGLYATEIDNEFFLIALSADKTTENMFIKIFDGKGDFYAGISGNLTNVTSNEIEDGSEPYNDRQFYAFTTAGRFVYFCNGFGHYWELEKTVDSFRLKPIDLEPGKTPLAYSYLTSNLKPASFTYFYDQIVASGFIRSELCDLSIPAISEEQNNQPPSELLNTARDVMTIDSGAVLVCEPALWRSFPVEDPGGFYWAYNERILATAGTNFDLLLFGSKRLYKIVNHGSTQPKRVRLGDIPSVSTRGHCYFDRYVFFVGFDGCYITDGNTVQKISFEMDPLWFGTEEPQTTRYVEQQIQKGAYPFHVNRNALSGVFCINDKERHQVMVSLPANDSHRNNMVWVYNYSDLIEGIGPGKWSIWGSNEESNYTGTSLTPGVSFPTNPAAPSPVTALNNMWNWMSSAVFVDGGKQRIFVGNNQGSIYEFGTTNQDFQSEFVYSRAGVRSGTQTIVPFPTVISLGRVGRVDSDGRIICTDVAVRRKQLAQNVEDNPSVTTLHAIVRSEGEGMKHFDVSETDAEFSCPILNSQNGVSENTKSVLNTMVLGASPVGSNAPLMNSEYIEAYARVNAPDGEGRAAYVDLYAMPTTEPHRLQVSEVRVHANVKGGSQREQS